MVMAFGLGLGMAQRTNIIASLVDPHEIGIASSLLALVRNIAGAFGIAIFATYLTKSIESNVLTINRFSSLHTSDPTTVATYIKLVILKAQINAYKDVYVLAAAVIFVGALTALTLKIKNENTTAVVHVE
jgi:uncharacterized membrane protein YgdD (TMEM256/DUF423 family)